MKSRTGLYGVVAAVCLSSLSGCAVRPSAPAQLLVLSPLAADPGVAARAGTDLPGLVVGPIVLPAYTERAQVLILKHAGEMHASATARWAEPLDQNFSRVLVDNLSRLLGSGRITTLGGARTPTGLQVTVEVTEFVTTDAGEARLTAYWQVLGEGGHAVLAHAKSHYAEAFAGDDYRARAGALSAALAALSRDLAAAIQRVAPRPE